MSSIPQAHRKRYFCAVLAILFFTLSNHAKAQQALERYQSIPRDSLSLTSIDIAALRNRKELEMIPWEVISAFGKQELGIDPLLISTVDISAGMPSVNGPEFGASIKTTVPVDIAKLNDKLFAGITTSPKAKDMQVRNVHGAPMKVVQFDPQTLLFGTEATLRRDLDKLDLIDCFRPTGSNVVIFDGSIRFLSKDIDELALEALVTSSGGER